MGRRYTIAAVGERAFGEAFFGPCVIDCGAGGGLLLGTTIAARCGGESAESSESSGILKAFVFRVASGKRTGADDGRDSNCLGDR